jgi:hypothetical protein
MGFLLHVMRHFIFIRIFEVFIVMKIEVEVFCVVTPYCGRIPTFLWILLKMKATRHSEKLVSYCTTTRRHNQKDLHLNVSKKINEVRFELHENMERYWADRSQNEITFRSLLSLEYLS